MRRLFLAAVLVVAATVAMVLPSEASAARPTCKSGKTVETSAYARIFRWEGERYLCRRSSGQIEEVGLNCGKEGPYDCYSLWVPRLRGRFLGYSISSGWKCSRWEVVVEDLAAGTEKLRVLTGQDAPDHSDSRVECSFNQGIGPASDLVLTATGSVGWIVAYYDIDNDLQARVYKAADTDAVLLARRRDIKTKSLRLSGDVMTWTAGRRDHTAPLG